jgi:hypothetical protein
MVAHDSEQVGDAEVARICSAWLSYQAMEDRRNEWAVGRIEGLLEGRDEALAIRVIRRLCETVDSANEEVVEMVGAGPLESFVSNYGAEALDNVERHGAACVGMRRAFVYVSGRGNSEVLRRIAEIRSEFGRQN